MIFSLFFSAKQVYLKKYSISTPKCIYESVIEFSMNFHVCITGNTHLTISLLFLINNVCFAKRTNKITRENIKKRKDKPYNYDLYVHMDTFAFCLLFIFVFFVL